MIDLRLKKERKKKIFLNFYFFAPRHTSVIGNKRKKKKWFKKLPSQNWSWLPWCLSLFRLKKIVFTSYYVYGGSDTGWQFMELSLDIFYDLIIYDEAILYKVYNHRVYQFIITLCWHIWFLIWNPLSTKANIYVYKQCA